MTDPVFFPRADISLAELAALADARLPEGVDGDVVVRRAAPFEEAEAGDLTVFCEPRRVALLKETRATACFLDPRFSADLPRGVAALETRQPEAAFALALTRLHPSGALETSLFGVPGVNPGAVVHPEARLEPGVIVDPGAVIGPRAEIGSGAVVCANAVIGPDVRIGRDSFIGAHAAIRCAFVGNRVKVRSGARLGEARAEAGLAQASVGRVIVQDEVEVGANAAVDRGVCADTVIGEGARLGDLVHVGGGAHIGRKCVLAAQVCVGAAARLDDFVVVGCQGAIAAGVRIGSGARVAPQAGVARDAPPGVSLAGSPAKPLRRFTRALAFAERGRND
ncbi:UDP-3-O-(3-hydroxymyristoyl)glucosamine N-acyltransferase [Methylocella sp.]|uniref:UDP-3-O-(3-hydroxymyristoyl)glucosamine N-acyltransferase n=1 Tax=Methylocella sp. TaxID=1978226 RepID=UPI0035B44C3C